MPNTVVLFLGRHRDALVRILPFGIYIAFLMLAPLLAHAFPEADSRWFYALQVGVVTVALALFARHYVELFSAPRLVAAQWAATLAVGIVVFILWISLDHPLLRMGSGGAGFDPRDVAGQIDWPLAMVRLCGAAVVVPVMEELFWRSFLMRWIDRPAFLSVHPASVSLRAVLFSALLFGVEHDLWLAGIVAGLAYGWLYVRTGNLWSPILAHGVTNLLLGLWILATGEWRLW